MSCEIQSWRIMDYSCSSIMRIADNKYSSMSKALPSFKRSNALLFFIYNHQHLINIYYHELTG